MISLELTDDNGNDIHVKNVREVLKISLHLNNTYVQSHRRAASTWVKKSVDSKNVHAFKRTFNDSAIFVNITPRQHFQGTTWSLMMYKSRDGNFYNIVINLTMSEELDKEGTVYYTAFVNPHQLRTSGNYFVAVDMDAPNEYENSWNVGNLSILYSLEVYETSCYYWDETKEEWSTYGCAVSIALYHFYLIQTG